MNLWNFALMGVIWGTVLGVVFSVAVLIIGRMEPEMLLHEYPPDIRAKYGPMRASVRRRANGAGLVLLVVLGSVVVLGLGQLRAASGELKFFETLLVSTVIFQVWNVLDLLVLDWFLLLTLRPKFMILRGTEGMAGYHDYKYHVRKFLKGIVLTAVLALVVTVITVGVERLR
jgi:hypothetical protein